MIFFMTYYLRMMYGGINILMISLNIFMAKLKQTINCCLFFTTLGDDIMDVNSINWNDALWNKLYQMHFWQSFCFYLEEFKKDGRIQGIIIIIIVIIIIIMKLGSATIS